jgi:GMP synthase-like glutamine amidotransferase
MRIGILQTGGVRAELAAAHGEYPPMFERLLAPHATLIETGDLAFEAFAIMDGAPVPAPDAADAWIVTGSRHGVYDPLPWIESAKAMLREARAARLPIIGVCFGHQLLAEAFGGAAAKFEGGWHVGAHDFALHGTAPWRDEGPRVTLQSLHQDQVLQLPADATVWASAPGCRYAGVSYGDPDRPDAISLQPHPEMSPEFARALVAHLEDMGRFPDGVGAVALETMANAKIENERAGRWLAKYLALFRR